MQLLTQYGRVTSKNTVTPYPVAMTPMPMLISFWKREIYNWWNILCYVLWGTLKKNTSHITIETLEQGNRIS